MRQNMIFATIKVVKSWDFQQYISMEKEQRIAIRRALNEDSDKLIQVIFKQLRVVFWVFSCLLTYNAGIKKYAIYKLLWLWLPC